jgi:hypothetical protein
MVPQLVAAYLERALAGDRPAVRQVRIEQEGQMWSKPGAGPHRFKATEHLAADRVAFAWRARFPIVPLLAMKVADDYAGGEGRLDVRLLGRTLQRQRGPEISVGEALRYLAELPWVPHALRGNVELTWKETGDRRLEVATRVGTESVSIALEFDAAGDIVRASSEARSFRRGETWVTMPWAGEFDAYQELGGMRMPTRAEVAWSLPEGRYVYWRGRVTAAVALETPFTLRR